LKDAEESMERRLGLSEFLANRWNRHREGSWGKVGIKCWFKKHM